MWNRFDKLTKSIIIMSIIAIITFWGAIITGKELHETFNKKQQIIKINADIRAKMIKVHDEGLRYK